MARKEKNSSINKQIFFIHLVSILNVDHASVFRQADNAIHWINHYPVVSAVCVILIRWIAIHPMDNVIQPSDNQRQSSIII